MGRTEADRKIASEPWLSMREVKRTTKATLRSASGVVCSKKDLTEPTLSEMTYQDLLLTVPQSSRWSVGTYGLARSARANALTNL